MASDPRRPANFYALGVRPALVEALAARGIVEPFVIQAASLPDSLAGRDVLGRGRTGSGKTVAFALPLLERVLAAPGRRLPGSPRALVLVPTRELAVQVHETIEFLASAVKVKAMTVFGGVRYTGQLRKLERGVDVVIATPGRLEDLIEQGALSLDAVEVVVLDEADLMADMGFLPPVTRILDKTPSGQRMLFSATLDADVARLVKRFLTDPLIHEVIDDVDGPDAEHFLFLVRHDNKPAVVQELLAGGGRALAFTRTKFAAERLARTLTEAGIPAIDLHGNLGQAARQRHLAAFADGKVSVLIATDIAARGIHVDDIGLVVHIDPPNDPKAFLHRSGRTARAGSSGTVVTLATKNQNKTVRHLMGQVKIKPTQYVVAPGDPILTKVRAPRVEPAASGTSMFAPNPEDAIEEPRENIDYHPRREPKAHTTGRRGARPDWSDTKPRPERGRTAPREGSDGGSRPDGNRGARPDRSEGRQRPERGRTVPREGSAARPRPERDRTAPRAGADAEPRPERNRPAPREWSNDWWGPEPWEAGAEQPMRRGHPVGPSLAGRPQRASRGDRAGERPDREGSRPARAGARPDRGGRPARGDDRGGRPGREDRGPRQGWQPRDERPAREDRRGAWVSDDQRRDRTPPPAADPAARAARSKSSAGGPKPKTRWTADDRRKRAESEALGFGSRTRAAKGKPGKDKGKGKSKGKPKRSGR